MKGAFTGAFANQEGLLERAKGGTIFLDELARFSNICK
jgi:transcriptional regulator with AAA-type ATPase domain